MMRRLILLTAALLFEGHLTQAVAQLSCSSPIQLTRNPGADFAPAWDPASETIAYMVTTAASVNDIGRVQSDGTGEGLMAKGPVNPFGIADSLSWVGGTGLLMTSEQIALHEYMTFNSALAPFTRTALDGDDAAFTRKLVIPGGGGGGLIRVSRDGLTVLWQHNDSFNVGANQIRQAPFSVLAGQATNAVGTQLTPLNRTGYYLRGASLTPNGSQFVISKPSGAGHDLFLHNTSDGSLVRQLTNTGQTHGADNRNPDISPDGIRAAFASNDNGAGGTQARFDLFAINLDGTGSVNMTNSPSVTELEPTWASDGQRLAFRAVNLTDATPNSDIYVCRAASPPSTLSVSPLSLNFAGLLGGASQRQALQISASGGTVSWSASVTLLNGMGWLVASPPSGTAIPNQPSKLALDVNFGAFGAAGIFQAVVLVRNTASGAAVRVPVTVTVGAPKSRLLLSQSSLTFRTVEGRTPPTQTLRILNGGIGDMNWSIPGNLTAPQNWLSFSALSGTASPGRTGASSTTLSISTAGLGAGIYQALVPVSAPGASNNPQLATVTLHVAPGSTAASPEISSSGLVFVAGPGGTATQSVAVHNTGGGSLAFLFLSAVPWLSVSPATGSASSAPATVQIAANAAGLNPGVYRVQLVSRFDPGGIQEVDVVLVVSSEPIVPARELPAAAQCAAQSMDVVMSTIGNGSLVPVSFPRPLLATVVDSCGAGVNDATVVANVEGIPISLDPLGDGRYGGTWVPTQVSSAVPFSVAALHATYPSVQRSFTVSTIATAGPASLPFIFPDGIVGAAGFTPRQPLAPGGIISIFGSGFSSAIHPALEVPLPRQLGGVSVRIGAEDVPLYAVHPGQINAQMPFTAQSGDTVSVVVNAAGKLTAPQTYRIASVQPGIFVEGTASAVLDGQSRLITAANPARLGDTLQIYTSGLGATDPPAQTGQANPSFSQVLQPVTVRIGGVQALVVYQGLAPCCVGVYQVNAVLPSTVVPGDAVLIEIEQNGVVSNPELPARIPVR